jgi:hypothetical protein
MREHYSYDEIYGTLIRRNLNDTERTYFVIECEYRSFYRWMYSHGWDLCNKKIYKNGYKATLRTNRTCV